MLVTVKFNNLRCTEIWSLGDRQEDSEFGDSLPFRMRVCLTTLTLRKKNREVELSLPSSEQLTVLLSSGHGQV